MRARKLKNEIHCFMIGTRHVFEVTFNIKIDTTQKSLPQFRFKPRDMRKISKHLNFE